MRNGLSLFMEAIGLILVGVCGVVFIFFIAGNLFGQWSTYEIEYDHNTEKYSLKENIQPFTRDKILLSSTDKETIVRMFDVLTQSEDN